VYIADESQRIRKVSASTGIITRIAGSSAKYVGGFSGDGSSATFAALNYPFGLDLDSSG